MHLSNLVSTMLFHQFKNFFVVTVCLSSVCMATSCTSSVDKTANNALDENKERLVIDSMLNDFNTAAANADFESYFGYFTEDAVFMGTDATEYWKKGAFQTWAKPYFDQKKTWSFRSVQRNIYFGKQPDIAWFDELLDTQMKICRGSGVVVKQDNQWKIQQYVLSMTIPNAMVDEVVSKKSLIEDSILITLAK